VVQLFNLLGNKRLLILLLGLIFFIAVMGFTLGKRNQVTWPEQIVKDTFAWTQGMLYKPARNIAGFFDDVSRLTIIYEENEILKRTLMKYAIDTQRLNELEANNLRLQEALEFTENQSRVNAYRYRIAEVYAMSPDLYNNTITINLGARDGIKENMAVVSTKGLVGRVNWVSQLSSNVQLITDIIKLMENEPSPSPGVSSSH
jgi:rod shape-determining protein MreC